MTVAQDVSEKPLKPSNTNGFSGSSNTLSQGKTDKKPGDSAETGLNRSIEQESNPTDTITILKAKVRLAKVNRWRNGVPHQDGSPNAKQFQAHSYPVDGIHTLAEILGKLEQNPRLCVIRGEWAAGDGWHPRRLHDRTNPKTGEAEAATVLDVPRRWIMLDIDRLELPEWLGYDDPEQVAQYAVEHLPEQFQGVTYYWQASGSAGFKSHRTAKVHLWFWLERPLTNDYLTRWAKGINAAAGFQLVDPAVFRAVQPHYTAAPIFQGCNDPLPVRAGLMEGKRDNVGTLVALPDRPRLKTTVPHSLQETVSFSEALARIGDGEGGLGFHDGVLQAAGAYVKEHGAKYTNPAELELALRNAVLAAPTNRDAAEIEHRASHEHIGGAITWWLEHGPQEPEKARRKRFYTDTPAHYQHDHTSTPEELTAEIRATVADFKQNPRNIALAVPAGSGKTTATAQVMFQNIGLNNVTNPLERASVLATAQTTRVADWYTKDHKLAESTRRVLEDNGVHAQVIRGRTHEVHGRPMCERWKEVKAVTSKGLKAWGTVCGDTCPHYRGCAYIKQFRTQAQVYVWTHEHMFLERPRLDRGKPEVAIVDESYHHAAIVTGRVALDAIRTADITPELRDAIVTALREGKPLLAAVRAIPGHMDMIQDAMSTLDAEPPSITPTTAPEVAKKLLEEYTPPGDMWTLLSVLRIEAETERDTSNAIEAYTDKEGAVWVKAHKRKKVGRGLGHTLPVLHLDATLEPTIHNLFFQGVEYVDLDAERHAHIVQCTDNRFSRSVLMPWDGSSESTKARAKNMLADIQGFIDRLRGEGKRVLLVTYKELVAPKEGLATLRADAVAWFGGLRGLDNFKDCDALVMVGRNEPPPHEINSKARALFFDDAKPLELPKQWQDNEQPRGYRTRTGESMGVAVKIHPDERAQAVVEQFREHEATQAIDRLRLIHRDKKAEAYILTSLPLDITVDELKPWREITGQSGRTDAVRGALVSSGVLPLHYGDLRTVCPGEFRSDESARGYTKKLLNNHGFIEFDKSGVAVINNIYYSQTRLNELGKSLEFKAKQYRPPHRKRWSTVITALDDQNTAKKLAELLGCEILIKPTEAEEPTFTRFEYRARAADPWRQAVNPVGVTEAEAWQHVHNRFGTCTGIRTAPDMPVEMRQSTVYEYQLEPGGEWLPVPQEAKTAPDAVALLKRLHGRVHNIRPRAQQNSVGASLVATLTKS